MGIVYKSEKVYSDMKLLFVRIVLMTILLHFEISMVLFLKEKLLYFNTFSSYDPLSKNQQKGIRK